MKRRLNSIETANLLEFASEEPLPEDGTVFDPLPGSVLGELGVEPGEPDGEAALHRLTGGVWTLQAVGKARA